MGRAYSMDLRERVVAAVAQEGLSRRQAAARFGVSEQHGDQLAEAGRNHRQRRAWPDRRSQAEEDRRPASRLAGPGAAGSGTSPCAGSWLSSPSAACKVDYRSVWEFVHAEKLGYKKRR